jgi:hypothetical protein
LQTHGTLSTSIQEQIFLIFLTLDYNGMVGVIFLVWQHRQRRRRLHDFWHNDQDWTWLER